MRLTLACIAALLVCAPAKPQTLPGFAAGSVRPELDWEARFRVIPDAANLRTYDQRLSARPHHVGSPYDKDNADWIFSLFRQWGLDARIETFDVLFPTPKERVLELVEPVPFTAKLEEPVVGGDPSTEQRAEQLPTYNAYSIDGDVTAPLVYVNYGVPDDYKELDRLGISVKGAIVIARYGSSWRGTKPKVAAEHGAVGCLIYSDPREDGYFEGETFPAGPYRPKDGVQRGSVMDMPVYPGDPLTPGIGSTPGAKRLPLSQAETLTKIPVMPISYADAQPLLAALGGPIAPEGWRGALPITYRVGPGPAKVRLKLSFDWGTKTLYDVIAQIPGAQYPDEWVIRGNHHDAWVNGAEDPSSGAASVLEEARGFAALLRQGWRPKRTVLFCVWDGEEPGLLGSTEWAEQHAAELTRKAVAYINSDSNGRGYLNMGGSQSLEQLINGVAREITDPETKRTVWSRLQARLISEGADRQELRSRADLRISALGSGSDYSVFLDHLGIPSLNLGYGGEDTGGIYHSIYDDFYWYTHFSDTDFAYGRALAQTAGTAVMRLAGAELIPYDFGGLSDAVRRYLNEVEKLARDQGDAVAERNRQILDGVFAATNDPRRPKALPVVEQVPPTLDFAPLEHAAGLLQTAAERYRKAALRAAGDGSKLAEASTAQANAKLMLVERALTLDSGLPSRPWFKHQIYAPGLYTGYGVKTLPAVRESIEQKQWDEAARQIPRLAKVLESASQAIDSAAAPLK